MSATQIFVITSDVLELREAFVSAVRNAQSTHGSRGGSGTIAEATHIALPMKLPAGPASIALARADALLHNDPRLAEPDGPVGAIALAGGTRARTLCFDRPLLDMLPFSPRDWRAAVAQAIVDRDHQGERVVAVTASRCPELGCHFAGAPVGRPLEGEIDVLTVGTREQTGWLLFGRATIDGSSSGNDKS